MKSDATNLGAQRLRRLVPTSDFSTLSVQRSAKGEGVRAANNSATSMTCLVRLADLH
jgi:hypothetical protein